jgi:hypothetical protein
MRTLCLPVILLLATLGTCLAVPKAGQGRDIDRILKRFPEYHVLTLAERNSDARTFIRAHFPKHNPSVVHADLDGDGHPDYAILLKDNKSLTAKLVFLLCSEKAQCKSVDEVDVTSSAGEVFIRPVPIGSRISQTDAIDTKDYPAPVKLRSTGIEVTYFGQAKVVYYWSRKGKKMETIQTED